MKINETFTSVLLGAVVAILGATGIINADEGADLTTYGTSAGAGIIGLVEVIRAIIKRGKGKGKNIDDDGCTGGGCVVTP